MEHVRTVNGAWLTQQESRLIDMRRYSANCSPKSSLVWLKCFVKAQTAHLTRVLFG